MKKKLVAILILCALISSCAGQKPTDEISEITETDLAVEVEPTETELIQPTNTEQPPPTPTPFPIPAPRFQHNLVYDQSADRYILFGGTSKVECGYNSDTWIYDLNTRTWSEVTTSNTPPAGQGTMAYDEESDRTILFIGTLAGEYEEISGGMTDQGGSTCVPFEKPETLIPGEETWVFDYESAEWSKIETSIGPSGLLGPKMVYNSTADRMVLFGGWFVGDGPKKGASAETWIFDFNSNTWTEMSPEISPPGRREHSMVYDSSADRVIIWGGGGYSPIDVGDIWAYDLASNTWEEFESSDAPRSKKNAGMVYDAFNNRVLLYFRKEFWSYEYNSNKWDILSNSPKPLALNYHLLVFDTSKNLVLTFGGGPNYAQWSNHTWIYDPATDEWTDVTK